MAGPMKIREELNVKKLMEVIPGHEEPSITSVKKLSKFAGNEEPPSCDIQDVLRNLASGNIDPNSADAKKYKICMIDNGKIVFPDERGKFCLDTSDGCVIKEITDGKERKDNDQNGQVDTNNDNIQSNDEKQESSTKASQAQKASKSSPSKSKPNKAQNEKQEFRKPPVERLDNNVMSKLLDYYRKFNERQLGLEVNEEQPGYRPSAEPPTPVICDNDIIKEAMMRVGQKQEAGLSIREPTLVASNDEDIMEPESKPHVEIKYSDQDEEEDEAAKEERERKEKEEFDEMFANLSSQYNEESWMYGANYIEKALEKTIDGERKGKVRTNKWGQDDIFKLVEILSKNHNSGADENEIDWSKGAYVAHYADYRDDVVYRLEELYDGGVYDHVYEETLFDRLKRAPASDDRSELRSLVAENSYFHRTGKDLQQLRTYQGGDELVIVMDFIKRFFHIDWWWSLYTKWFPRQPSRRQRSTAVSTRNGWFNWLYNFPKIQALTAWFRRTFNLPTAGKPIYKHVEYQNTDVVDWQKRYSTESQESRLLKNRRTRGHRNETVLDVEDDAKGDQTDRSCAKKSISTVEVDETFSEEMDFKKRESRKKDDYVLVFDA